jgi:hypothetical protein
MTDTSSEPTLAFETMKQPFEQKMWGSLLQEWSCSLWTVILRTIWIGVAIAACIGALRLMAWADTGSRGDGTTIETTIKPTNRNES